MQQWYWSIKTCVSYERLKTKDKVCLWNVLSDMSLHCCNEIWLIALHGYAPPYIRELLTVYEPRRTLRSESKGKFVVPRSHKKSAGDRAFSVSAPRLWNELPQNVTECKTIDSFKNIWRLIFLILHTSHNILITLLFVCFSQLPLPCLAIVFFLLLFLCLFVFTL